MSVERLIRLHDAGLFGFWVVDPDIINLDDLLGQHRPGAIVRAYGDVNAIRFIPVECEALGCVAGWISDEGEWK
jgi:hypothetical protein